MDISKLPRLSQTSAPPPQDSPEAETPPVAGTGFPVVHPAPPTSTQQSQSVWCRHCNAPNAPTSAYCSGCGAPLRTLAPAGVEPGVGAEVWVSAIVGIVLMLMGLTFAKWAITTMTGGTYDTGATWGAPVDGRTDNRPEGSPIGYWELPGYTALADMAIFLFGLAMVLEAIVLLAVHSRIRAKSPLLAIALTITLVATILNVLVVAKLFSIGVMPLLSLLAIAFGGYIAVYEWKLFQYFRSAPRTT